VSKLEERLRDAFNADAETVKAGSIPGPPVPAAPPRSMPRLATWTRFRRLRLLIPMAAALAVVAVVVAAAALPLGRGHTHSAVGNKAAGSAGLPQYFVTNEPGGAVDQYSLVVRSTRTGKIVGQLKPYGGVPYGGAAGSGSVAAIGGDRAYVTAVPVGGPCLSQLEEFRLNGLGQPGSLTPLHVTVRGDFDGFDNLAITPDGRTIAYATYVCGSGGKYELSVVDLATGHVKTWSYTSTNLASPGALEMSPDGREVLFTLGLAGPERILRTSAPAGSLSARSQVISSNTSWAALAHNGAVLYGCTVSPPPSVSRTTGTITFFSRTLARTGERVIASYRNVLYPTCTPSLDPGGRYLLVDLWAGLPRHLDWIRTVVLDLRSGRTLVIPAPGLPSQGSVAW
jgi:hypothetical protein